MREYITRVVDLVKPYRFRFGLGLLCGFLSGMLAFTLPVSLKLAVDTVFPNAKAAKKGGVVSTNSVVTTAGVATNQIAGQTASTSGSSLVPQPTGKLKRALDSALNW